MQQCIDVQNILFVTYMEEEEYTKELILKHILDEYIIF